MSTRETLTLLRDEAEDPLLRGACVRALARLPTEHKETRTLCVGRFPCLHEERSPGVFCPKCSRTGSDECVWCGKDRDDHIEALEIAIATL